MSNANIIRVSKDPEYRPGLSEAERAQLPEHPVELTELTDAQLDHVEGGWGEMFGGLTRIGAHFGDWLACEVHGDELASEQCDDSYADSSF